MADWEDIVDDQQDTTPSLEERIAARDGVHQELIATQEQLDREVYRHDTIEITLDIVRSDFEELSSLSLAGITSALFGSRAGKLDAKRNELEKLEREQRECETAIEGLTRTVEELRTRLAGSQGLEEEVQQCVATDAAEAGSPSPRPSVHDLQRALDAGESLINNVESGFRTCSGLRNRASMFSSSHVPLIAAVANSARHSAATGLTGQIANSVRHCCTQLAKLPLGPDYLPDVCTLLPRLEQYTDPASLPTGAAGIDAWAELETIARSIVDDLQEELRRAER